MIHKKLILSIWLLNMSVFSAIAQDSSIANVRSSLNQTKDRFIISYDLEKGKTGYWDIQLIAYIDNLRIDPSRQALDGDVGQHIRHGRNHIIVWKWPVDVTNIDGKVRFEVVANTPGVPPPPLPGFDYLASGILTTGGATLLVSGIVTMLKKGAIDPNVTPSSDPIVYYYTFCDPNSEHFISDNVISDQNNNTESLCDQHLNNANDKYRSASLRSLVGGALMLGGAYILWKKPILNQILMPKYLEDNGLAIRPIFNLSPLSVNGGVTGNIGLKVTYHVGR